MSRRDTNSRMARDFVKRISNSSTSIASYYGDVGLYIEQNARRLQSRMRNSPMLNREFLTWEEWDNIIPPSRRVQNPYKTMTYRPAQRHANRGIGFSDYNGITSSTSNAYTQSHAPRLINNDRNGTGGEGVPPSDSSTKSESKDGDYGDEGKNHSLRGVSRLLRSIVALTALGVSILKKLANVSISTATETVSRGMTAVELGLTTSQVRGYSIFDKAHGLSAGTTVGAMYDVGSSFLDINNMNQATLDGLAVALGKDNYIDLKDFIESGINGEMSIPEMTKQILDGFFDLWKKGENQYGGYVGQEESATILANFLRNTMGQGNLADMFVAMVRDATTGNFGSFDDFEGWFNSVELRAVTKETTDYLEAFGDYINTINARLETLKDAFSADFLYHFSAFADYINNLRLGMSASESAYETQKNRLTNNMRIDELGKRAGPLVSELNKYAMSAGIYNLFDEDGSINEEALGAFGTHAYDDILNGSGMMQKLSEYVALHNAIVAMQKENESDTTKTVFASTDASLEYEAQKLFSEFSDMFNPALWLSSGGHRKIYGSALDYTYSLGYGGYTTWDYNPYTAFQGLSIGAKNTYMTATSSLLNDLLNSGLGASVLGNKSLLALAEFLNSNGIAHIETKNGMLTANGLKQLQDMYKNKPDFLYDATVAMADAIIQKGNDMSDEFTPYLEASGMDGSHSVYTYGGVSTTSGGGSNPALLATLLNNEAERLNSEAEKSAIAELVRRIGNGTEVLKAERQFSEDGKSYNLSITFKMNQNGGAIGTTHVGTFSLDQNGDLGSYTVNGS